MYATSVFDLADLYKQASAEHRHSFDPANFCEPHVGILSLFFHSSALFPASISGVPSLSPSTSHLSLSIPLRSLTDSHRANPARAGARASANQKRVDSLPAAGRIFVQQQHGTKGTRFRDGMFHAFAYAFAICYVDTCYSGALKHMRL